MPDEIQRSVPRHLRGDGDADLLDQTLEHRVAFGRYPATWIEFAHGVAHLARAGAAEKLRIADAVAAHKQKDADWRRWKADHQYLAGSG